MLIIYFFVSLSIVSLNASSPTFYAGLMQFSPDTKTQTHTVGKVSMPISILSLSSLEYSDSFELFTHRRLYSKNKEHYFEVNLFAQNNNSEHFRWSAQVHYLLSRPLANIEVYTINLTASNPTATIKLKYLDIGRSRCIIFPLGFSNSTLTQRITAHPHIQTQQFLVSSKSNLTHKDHWIHLEAVVFELDNPKCGILSPRDFSEDILEESIDKGMQPPKNIEIDIVLPSRMQLAPGITELHHFQIGHISYLPKQSKIRIDQKGFSYSVIPINTTCYYVNESKHSTVFIVFLSIFTGIFGVVLIAFIAYCINKRFERRKHMLNEEQPQQPITPNQQQLDKEQMEANKNILLDPIYSQVNNEGYHTTTCLPNVLQPVDSSQKLPAQ